jgi:23S rRNA (adenine2503-C2)-methyltransferase
MPINRKYNLGILLKTLRDESSLRPDRKVFFEYVMLAGVNDRFVSTHVTISLVTFQIRKTVKKWV